MQKTDFELAPYRRFALRIAMLKVRKNDVVEALVIGATAGLTCSGVIIAARLAADPGDVLGFVGGAVGAGLAVVGALLLEARSRAVRAAENAAPFEHLLEALRTELSGMVQPKPSLYPLHDLNNSLLVLSTSANLIMKSAISMHLNKIQQILAVNELARALECTVKLYQAESYDNRVAEINEEEAQSILEILWPPLGEVFFAVDRISDMLGYVYPSGYPWGWPLEAPRLVTVEKSKHN